MVRGEINEKDVDGGAARCFMAGGDGCTWCLPVILSHNMREVMMRPYGLNSDSKSDWSMFFGSPDTYRFAPFIASELGRANDTYKTKTELLRLL